MEGAREIVLWLNWVDEILWSRFLVILLVGVGLYFTIRLKGMQFRYLGHSLKLAFTARTTRRKGTSASFKR